MMEKRYIPFGYRMENGKTVINEEEAGIIRRIYEMRIKGESVTAIGKKLYDEGLTFFSDTKEKSVKKASAILYKGIYAGEKDYPAIVDKESFLCVGSMKPPPIRKSCRKREMISDSAESFDFEYSECLEAMDMEREISEIIEKRKAGSTEVLGMILRLAEMKYSCIVQKEEK